MPGVSAARKLIVCLFALGVILTLAGHRYQTGKRDAQITWQDVNYELQHVESARVELFAALNQKLAGDRRTQPVIVNAD